jgi:uncharacterized protein (TIGR04141 family)
MAAKKKTGTIASKKTKSGEVWPLTVFLLKPDIKTFKDALHAKSKSVDIHPIAGLGGLALKTATAKTPKWATRLATVVPNAATLLQQSPGALLFVEAAGNKFAVTFGYGRSLLAPEAIVHDFGIRTVLNTVDPKLIRSLDSRTLEVSPQLSRKQFVEDRPLAAFALDRIHDLLKGVTGRVKSGGTKFESDLVTGTDSLHCRVRIDDLKEIGSCCSGFQLLYKKKDYQANFDFIDHVRFIRDPVLVKKLDALLLAKAKSKTALKDFGFAPPRLLAGEELSRLQRSWEKTLGPGEVRPDAVRERLGELALKASSPEDFVERLKRDRIELCDEAGAVVEPWSLYRCVLLEVMSMKAHILTTGDWYEVSKTFVDEITKRFDKIVSDSLKGCPIKLPKQKKAHKREDEYNADTAKVLKIQNYDKKSLTTGTGADQVEPCDLLDTKNGIFVHVKIGRTSTKMSHLFNQGLVATLTFLDDERARENVRNEWPAAKKAKVLQEPIQASKLTTVFAIIDKLANKKPWRLPFFSMLVASSVTDRIAQRGVRVHTVRVDAA